jgi:hypothetical protein
LAKSPLHPPQAATIIGAHNDLHAEVCPLALGRAFPGKQARDVIGGVVDLIAPQAGKLGKRRRWGRRL